MPQHAEEVDGRRGRHQLPGAGYGRQVHLCPRPRGFHRAGNGEWSNLPGMSPHCQGFIFITNLSFGYSEGTNLRVRKLRG